MAIKGATRTPRPSAWCHPDKNYQAKGLCQGCYRKKWRAEHPEQNKVHWLKSHQNRRLKMYKISQESYDELYQQQEGSCAICKNPPVGKTILSVDHNHETGRVRGLLCDPCNFTLGLVKENPVTLTRMQNYITGFSYDG